MMNIKHKITAILFTLLISTNCLAKKLDVYYCSSLADAEICSKSCKNTLLNAKYDPNQAQKLEFFVNEKTGTVLEKTYFGEKLSQSDFHNNCRILDKNNWDCSTDPIWVPQAQWHVMQTKKMIDGVYITGLRNSKQKEGVSVTSSCAK